MSAMAAARLGYRCHVFAPEPEGPAMQVAAAATVAGYEDGAALEAFAGAVDVVTFEFENVPAGALAVLAQHVPCRPAAAALAICQDRLIEKRFLEDVAGVPVAPWRPVRTEAELAEALGVIGLPAVLKTTRLGYDGRGQAMLRRAQDAAQAWARLAPRPLILEALVPFVVELSAIAARAPDGSVAVYDAVENRHADHILDVSFAPARVPAQVAEAARGHAAKVAAALELVGVMALELFLLPDGRLLGNEIAPRPHNSGHWTMEACLVSQFEQHVRAVAGLPLAPADRHHDAVMRNLVGPDGLARWPALLRQPGIAPHLYGKSASRPGRKLGHATRLLPLGRLAVSDEASVLSGL
jgi:5-(carboxyamino)imidazole ribonucleotide synthase